MNNKFWFLCLAGCLSAAVLGSGCTPVQSEMGSSGVTLTRVEASDVRLEVEATNGDAHVHILIHRTGPRVEGFVPDPDPAVDSPYESNVLVYNRFDFPFIMNFGGDPTDEGMPAIPTEPPAQTNQDQQREDLQLVLDAVAQLQARSDVNDVWHWELREVHNMATFSLQHADDGINGELHPQPTPGVSEIEHEAIGPVLVYQGADATGIRSSVPASDGVTAATAYLGSTYIHQAYITWKSCCWTFGHHSAVVVQSYYDTGVYIGYVSTSNHGTEASDPSMSVASGCPHSWSGRTGMFPVIQPYVVIDTYSTGDAGGCSTSYGLGSGYHVCNDDSQAQYWDVKYNALASWVTCGDSSLRTTEPSCD